MDNQFAIAIARNPELHDRTKHVEIRHHFLRQKLDEKELDLTYVPTGEQVARFDEGLGAGEARSLSEAMGVRRVD